jgi:hypothetical protein
VLTLIRRACFALIFTAILFCGQAALAQCVNDCSGNGFCDVEICLCDAGWEGVDCSTPTCNGVNNCSGQGTCIAPDTCACYVGWTDADCSVEVFDCSGVNECSGQGNCIEQDLCACNVGWQGVDCSTPTCDGVNNCSGQGTCTAPDTCSCYVGWQGADCSVAVVPVVPLFSQWGSALLALLLVTCGVLCARSESRKYKQRFPHHR